MCLEQDHYPIPELDEAITDWNWCLRSGPITDKRKPRQLRVGVIHGYGSLEELREDRDRVSVQQRRRMRGPILEVECLNASPLRPHMRRYDTLDHTHNGRRQQGIRTDHRCRLATST